MTEPRYPKTFFHDNISTDVNLSVYLVGIVVINPSPGQWRAAFIDELGGHPLKVTVQRFENGQLVSEHPVTAPVHSRAMRINVTPKNSRPEVGYVPSDIGCNREHSLMGNFSSGELYGRRVRLSTGHKPKLSTLYLNHGSGYTARLSDYSDGNPDYYVFDKQGNSPRWLGHWFGIDAECKVDSELNFRINGTPVLINGAKLTFSAGASYRVIFDAACSDEQCTKKVKEGSVNDSIDFPYYFVAEHEGKKGIVDEEPIRLIRPGHPENEEALNRVACNAMLVDDFSFTDGPQAMWQEETAEQS